MNPNRNTIVFEEVTPRGQLLVRIYLALNFQIYFLKITSTIKDSVQIQAWLNSGQIKKVPFESRIDFMDAIADTPAFDAVEKLYPWYLKSNSYWNDLKKLFDSDDLDLILKNMLMKKLTRFLYINTNLNKISEALSSQSNRLYFIPVRRVHLFHINACETIDYENFNKEALSEKLEILPTGKVRFPGWLITLEKMKLIFRKIISLFQILALPFIWQWKSKGFNQKREFKYGQTILTQRQFENPIKSLDFLIDGQDIRKDEIIFIPFMPLTPENIEYLKSKNLNFNESVDRNLDLESIRQARPYLLSLLKYLLESESDAYENAIRVIHYYVKWQTVIKYLRIKHFITQNTDTTSQAIVRDMLFAKSGISIWKYMDSASLVNYTFPSKEFLNRKENTFAYMFCDHLVSWSKDNNDVFKTTRSKVNEYHETGHLWAEHVRLLREGKLSSGLKEKIYAKGYHDQMKLVAVFDSTYDDHWLNSFDDGCRFLEDILKVIDEFPDIYMVLKGKKSRALTTKNSIRLNKLYDQMENHPRVFLGENTLSPSEVIALAYLVISFPFTSTGLEALSTKTRSLWYDPANKQSGTFYDEAEGLVCHSLEQLKRRIRALLYEISDAVFEEFLRTKVKNYGCLYFDGMGITRLRKLLTGKEVSETDEREIKGPGKLIKTTAGR